MTEFVIHKIDDEVPLSLISSSSSYPPLRSEAPSAEAAVKEWLSYYECLFKDKCYSYCFEVKDDNHTYIIDVEVEEERRYLCDDITPRGDSPE